MADAPWRCSQCGTINEPVANACRTCGRWPSLFDLESSTIEQGAAPDEDRAPDPQPIEVDEPAPVPEPDAQPVEAELPPEFEAEEEADEPETARRPGWRRYARLIVPIGVALYLLISALVDRGG